MYKLLIVDDEPLVQIGLQSMLPWAEMDITICATASNGKQALNLIQTLHPDLVITDIKMPLMNGLELLETCHSILETVPEFIILTCYEDFPYIKKALKYQAVDYIIKLGIQPEELRSSVERALKHIKDRHAADPAGGFKPSLDMQNYKEKFILKLLNNLFESPEQFALQSRQLGFSFLADYYVAAACTIDHTPVSPDSDQYISLYHNTLALLHNILSKYLTFHLVSLDMKHFYILFEITADSAFIKPESFLPLLSEAFQMIEHYFEVGVLYAVGSYKKDIRLISESCQEARQILPLCTRKQPALFYPEYASSEKPELKNTFNLSLLKGDIQKAFEEYDMLAFQHITESIEALFRSKPGSYIQAMDVTSSILHICLTMLPDIEPFLAESFSQYRDSYRSLYNQQTTQKVMDWLNLFSGFVIQFYHNQSRKLKNTLISNVIQYIDAHLNEKLVLNDVAATFSISPNYLGHLFKKNTSMGFNEYVIQAKISRAKYLMFHTDLKIYEIAIELGFENSFYFSRVFKKIEGCSPRQYMQEQPTLAAKPDLARQPDSDRQMDPGKQPDSHQKMDPGRQTPEGSDRP